MVATFAMPECCRRRPEAALEWIAYFEQNAVSLLDVPESLASGKIR